jgi:hypothetical protein
MIRSRIWTCIHRDSRLFLHTYRQMSTLTTEFGNIGYTKQVNNRPRGVCNRHEDDQPQEPDRTERLDLTMYPNPLKRSREDDRNGYESFKRPRRFLDSAPFHRSFFYYSCPRVLPKLTPLKHRRFLEPCSSLALHEATKR